MLLFYIVVTCVVGIRGSSELLQCQFATTNKYLGLFFVLSGTLDHSYFLSYQANNSEVCKEDCRRHEDCLAASFHMSLRCSFYNKTNITVRFDNSYDNRVFIWNQCKWNTWAKTPSDGRCKGMFIGYIGRAAVVTNKYMKLQEVKNVEVSDCMDLCSRNPICKIFNYNLSKMQCDLLQGWPSFYVREAADNRTVKYEWTCIPNFIETLTYKQEPRKANRVKCTGFWNITDRNARMDNTSSSGAMFYTQSFESCLEECNANLKCNEVLFNVSFSVCILQPVQDSKYNKYVVDLRYIRFQWVCTKNDAQYPQENEKEKRFELLGWKCVQLINNTNLYISEDKCGKPKGAWKLCTDLSEKILWTVTDTCLMDQTFWVISSQNITFNGSLETRIMTRVFTGLTSFWLMHESYEIFNSTKFLECRKFDGSVSRERTNVNDIIDRQRWNAIKVQKKFQKPFFPFREYPPKIIIIDSSEIPFYGCRTLMACTSILRNLQIRSFNGIGPIPSLDDIPYNFMLNENGSVYEVLGWSNRCRAFIDYPDSLCFAFIGSVNETYPTFEFLEGLKKLINLAVYKGYVDQNYSLYVYTDATGIDKKRPLALVIKNWFRYRGFVPQYCGSMSVATEVLNGIFVLLVSAMISLAYKWGFQRISCSKCYFLGGVRFEKIYPKAEQVRDNSLTGLFMLGDFLGKYCLVAEKSGVISPHLKIVKIWIVNMFIESDNSKFVGNNLQTFLNTYKNDSIKTHVYKGMKVSDKNLVFGKLMIILCVSNTSVFETFERALVKNVCICKQFKVEIMSFPNLPFRNLNA